MRAQEVERDLPFRQLAEHLPTPCWISDEEGRIIWVNRAWLTYTGKDAHDLAREGLAVLHDPEVLPRVQQKWAATKEAGKPDEMVFPLRGKDGQFRPFHTRVVPVRDAEGRIWRWFGTNTDVSREAEAEERARRSEAVLHENEARLRLATEAAGVGVWEWRLATNEMIYSPKAKEICGFDLDGPVTYDMVVAVTHPDDLPRTSAQAARALDPRLRERCTYDYRIVRPSGEIRWVTATGEAVFGVGLDGNLQALRYVGTLVDVTERRAAEDAVRASESHLQMALRAGRMAAWRIDGAGNLAPSPELNALIGLAPEATPTLTDLTQNYLPGEWERIQAAADLARLRGERHFEVEYRYRRADGQVRWFNTRAEAQVAADGSPDGAIGIAADITDRKLDEERLKVLAREVDHRANNLMTIVESIVALSHGETVSELREVLRGRIHALATAHQLLAEARWTGAGLRTLVEEELAPYDLGGHQRRLEISGPEVTLRPAAAQTIAMVVHELATNAAKHGALSRDAGSVHVEWSIDPDVGVRLRWTERGGPEVRPPERKGFGSSVIARALQEFGAGKGHLEWRPEGLVAELILGEL